MKIINLDPNNLEKAATIHQIICCITENLSITRPGGTFTGRIIGWHVCKVAFHTPAGVLDQFAPLMKFLPQELAE